MADLILDNLVKEAAKLRMSPAELQEQRISFAWGCLPASSAATREDVARVDYARYGNLRELENEMAQLRADLAKAQEALTEIANYKLSEPTRHFSGPSPEDELDATVPADEAEYLISVAREALAPKAGEPQ